MTSKYQTSADTRTVDTILTKINSKYNTIDLEPSYQRGIVWTYDKQIRFIESVIVGIVPNPLIFNIDTEEQKQVCIDGKQRIYSLINFHKNIIPHIEVKDNDEEVHYYFDKIPDTEYGPNVRVMTTVERANFLNRPIPAVSYTNLTYQEQVDIFNRIQNGVALRHGELIIASIKNEELNKYFKKICEPYENIIKPFISFKRVNTSYITYITDIMKMVSTNTFSGFTQAARLEYIKQFDSIKMIDDNTQVLEIIKLVLTKLLNIEGINPCKIHKNIIYSFVYVLYTDNDNVDIIDVVDDIYEQIAEQLVNDSIKTKKIQNIKTLIEIIKNNYKLLDKNKNKIQELELELETKLEDERKATKSNKSNKSHNTKDKTNIKNTSFITTTKTNSNFVNDNSNCTYRKSKINKKK